MITALAALTLATQLELRLTIPDGGPVLVSLPELREGEQAPMEVLRKGGGKVRFELEVRSESDGDWRLAFHVSEVLKAKNGKEKLKLILAPTLTLDEGQEAEFFAGSEVSAEPGAPRVGYHIVAHVQ